MKGDVDQWAGILGFIVAIIKLILMQKSKRDH